MKIITILAERIRDTLLKVFLPDWGAKTGKMPTKKRGVTPALNVDCDTKKQKYFHHE